MANHVEKHLGNSDTEYSRTKKKCLCFEVCALCLSSTIESSRLYMWRNLVESRWYPTASSAQIFQLCTIELASSNDHLSKLKLSAHYIKNIKYNIYRGIDIDMWCASHPSSPIRICVHARMQCGQTMSAIGISNSNQSDLVQCV